MQARWLHVYDPRALHAIFVKDQEKDIFTRDPVSSKYAIGTFFITTMTSYRQYIFNRGARVILGPGLLATAGTVHRKQRRMLQPVFSVAHLRNMTPTFYDITRKVRGRRT